MMHYVSAAALMTILSCCSGSSRQPHKEALPPVPTLLHRVGVPATIGDPQRMVATGPEGAVAVQLPGGGIPGHIFHINTAGVAKVAEGYLMADALLRFHDVEDNTVRADSLDNSVYYLAPERVSSADAIESSGLRCCDWSERSTLWRVAPGKLEAGLLRTVSGPALRWGALHWYKPGQRSPLWHVSLGNGIGVAAAAVAPNAEQFLVLIRNGSREQTLQARNTKDGSVSWARALGKESDGISIRDSRLVYSSDGARFALLLPDPEHCVSCVQIVVHESGTGKLLHRVPLGPSVETRFAWLGVTGGLVWLFVHVPEKRTDMSNIPELCEYYVYDLASGKRVRGLEDTHPAWGISDCTAIALVPRYDAPGVIAFRELGNQLQIQVADTAP